jgi:hypothetical protein
MTTTEYVRTDPPTYERPPTLREALAAGLDLSALDADHVGMLATDQLAPEGIARQGAFERAYVDAALAGDARFCVPIRNDEGGYTLTWPNQDQLNGEQWFADLCAEPELLEEVRARLTPEQVAVIEGHEDDRREELALLARIHDGVRHAPERLRLAIAGMLDAWERGEEAGH